MDTNQRDLGYLKIRNRKLKRLLLEEPILSGGILEDEEPDVGIEAMLEAIMGRRNRLAAISHVTGLSSGMIWFFKAWELKYSSDVLYRSRVRRKQVLFSLLSQELLLLGYAFELLFKSNYFSKNQVTKMPKNLKEHDLVKLARIAVPRKFSQAEIGLLKYLSTMTVWQGGYPIALYPDGNVPAHFKPEDILRLRKLWRSISFAAPREIFREFKTHLVKIEGRRGNLARAFNVD